MRIITIALFASILFFSSNCFADDKLRAAFILPLSGPSSFWGTQMRDGAMLAYEGLPDQLKEKIELEFEDDAFTARNTISAYRRIKETGSPDVIAVFGSSAGEALSSVVERDKIPMFVVTALENISLNRSYVIRYWLSSEMQVQSILTELRKRNYSRIGVVVSSFSALLDVEEKFRLSLDKKSKVVAREEISSEMSDFRTLISRLLSNKPEVLLVLLLPGQASTFMKQLRANDQKIVVYGNSAIENGSEVKAASGAMDGIIYPGPNFSDEFVALFKKRFDDSPEMAAGNGFDLVKMLAGAIEQDVYDAENLNDYLHQLDDFSGVLGRYGITKQNAFDVEPVTKIIRNGRFELLE